MPASDEVFYERSIRRITWLILILGLVGTACLALLLGLKTSAAFLIGSLLSYASFKGWERLVAGLAPNARKRSPWFVARTIALLASAYVIIKFLGLNVAAALGGLLVSAAALILELIYELIYART
jgi:hypothetical protein